jgi:hypothetical protein
MELPIGEWRVGDGEHFIAFALKKKPNPWHRFWAWCFFGLKWKDYPQPQMSKPSKGIRVGRTIEVAKGRR